jgi:2-phospho-L-lactate/phosphoenolpyruvate guanylyltransferase
MSRWLLTPVKPLADAKSRLAPLLATEERSALMRQLLGRTLAFAAQTALFSRILVVSRDPAVWELAHAAGASTLPEQGSDLNSALAQGCAYALREGAQSILILPADLPLLTADDLASLCALGEVGDGLVLAPSQDGGTNGLHLRLPPALPFCFGAGSYTRHLAAAAACGLTPITYDSSTLRFDLDWPADLAMLPSLSQGGL